MADKPSRALVLYGDGLARSVGPTNAHLHSFVSLASCGFLALPHSPPSEDAETRIVREFAELLDANEVHKIWDERESFKNRCEERPTISERFMGMKAAIVTDNLSLKSLGGKLGFTVFRLCDKTPSLAEVPSLVTEWLKLLGFQDGKVLDSSQFDLVIVHVGASEKTSDIKNIEFINQLVGNLLHMEQSNADISSRLHASVIMSYGDVLEGDNLQFSISDTKHMNDRELSPLFPRQSYMMKGGKPRENIRHLCPLLCAQYQKAVTRKDMVEQFSFRDFIENGVNLVMPADRFLHEVAFKLWKAPKYGA